MRRQVPCPAAALLALVLLVPDSDVAAQASTRVHGDVRSAAAGSPMARVTIAATSGTMRSEVTTGASGTFDFVLPSLPATLVATRLGFAPETVVVAHGAGAVAFRMRAVPLALAPVVVHTERAGSAASSGVVRELDILLRPRTSAQELLRLVPGLVVAQHAGGGKAEQLYLRGFDADHGTDVALSVDGIPVNMVTHAHGQGYADLHWLMPEVVEAVEVRKGPFDVRDGDFATAGAVAFRTRDRVDAPTLDARAGSFGARQLTALLPMGGDAARAGGYVAVATQLNDGPFEAPQRYRRSNAFARWSMPLSPRVELHALASSFAARWDASGQVPERAVRTGLISRFGAIDPSEGGTTSRHDVSLAVRSRGGPGAWEARVFATRYRFGLFSNFTLFLVDSVNGDGIEQVDDRVMSGALASYARESRLGARPSRWSVGGAVRGDAGDVALHQQRERRRLARLVDARSTQASLSPWARYEVQLTPRLRVDAGARADVFRFAIADRVGEDTVGGIPHGSGTAWHAIVSPRLNLAFDLAAGTRLFANAGSGFHSNDGRDAILATAGDRMLPRAVSAELGARRTWDGGTLAGALWGLDLQSETVFVGDAGTTEASGRTRRVGIDVEVRHRLQPWLWADADFNIARGRFRDAPAGEDHIPLAPARTITAGLGVRDTGPIDGGLRVRHIAGRPANEDGSVRASGQVVWELFAGVRRDRARLYLAVDNLFDTTWNEAQFATTSRLRGEARGITELHFTPGAPRSAQVGVSYRF